MKKKRIRYYGLTKVIRGQKVCWLSRQNKHGYSLGLALNNRTIWLRNIRIADNKEVARIIKSGIVFVELKKS